MVMGLTPKGWVEGSQYPKFIPCDDCKHPIPIEEWDQVEQFQYIWDCGFLCQSCQWKFQVRVAEDGY